MAEIREVKVGDIRPYERNYCDVIVKRWENLSGDKAVAE